MLASATLAGGAVHAASEPDGQANATSWPRPWDPADGIDLTGAGATPEQEQRAAALIEATLEYLPQFADTATAYDLGYRSIGDASTGYEHYVNYARRRRRVARPAPAESLVTASTVPAHANVGDVHRCRLRLMIRVGRLRRAADAVARARQPAGAAVPTAASWPWRPTASVR